MRLRNQLKQRYTVVLAPEHCSGNLERLAGSFNSICSVLLLALFLVSCGGGEEASAESSIQCGSARCDFALPKASEEGSNSLSHPNKIPANEQRSSIIFHLPNAGNVNMSIRELVGNFDTILYKRELNGTRTEVQQFPTPVSRSVPVYLSSGIYELVILSDVNSTSSREYTVDVTLHYDRDEDRVLDEVDRCHDGITGWTSDASNDKDGDGCRDEDEDEDDDGDGKGDAVDHCARGETGWRSDERTDNDGDGCRDQGEDVDDDGDGLIELRTKEELNNMRWALDGVGYRESAADALNSFGCGEMLAVSCEGYELIESLDLAADSTVWEPVGGEDGCDGEPFSAIFEGNDNSIFGLNITQKGRDCLGLFGVLSATAEMRNIHLKDTHIEGRAMIGGLVGKGQGVTITGVSVIGNVYGNVDIIGGLVGNGADATIESSFFVGNLGNIEDEVNVVGGLLGLGIGASIISSYAISNITGQGSIGGLIGNGDKSQIVASYATGHIFGNGNSRQVGGLVGSGTESNILASYAANDMIGSSGVGGLIGNGTNAAITASYATGEVGEGDMKGGLVGVRSGTNIVVSYWNNQTSGVFAIPADGSSMDSGQPKTTEQLQVNQMTEDSIYAEWIKHLCPNTSIGVWDFGDADQYPAITCTPNGIDIQPLFEKSSRISTICEPLEFVEVPGC